MTERRFVSVLVPIPAGPNETFTYEAEEPVAIGERVSVTFGRREVIGIVVEEAASRPDARVIEGRCDGFPVLTREILALTRWMADRLFVPWYRCIETAVPSGLKMAAAGARPRTRRVLVPLDRPAPVREERHESCLRMVAAHPGAFTIAEAAARLEVSRGVVENLVKRGSLGVTHVPDRRDPFRGSEPPPRDTPPDLTTDQEKALQRIAGAGPGGEILLWGVTGSGKTEVYLRAISSALERGESAIVLVPEISLTPQTVDRFRARFGETVAILHSALSQGERFDEWMRLRRGEARVAVGARSAIFAPVDRLGVIVVDEAHESSYKQADSPRYHAIDVARRRARQAGAVLVLGTATPTCELVHAAGGVPPGPAAESPSTPGTENCGPARLPARVAGRPMPETRIVDMRLELAEGHTGIFSRMLLREMRKTLERKEQALLFLNRRGHASFILCRGCGEAVRCPHCSVSLTLHGSERRHTARPHGRAPELVCHICNHRVLQPQVCPACGSKKIRSFGAGTERIEEEAARVCPGARIARMDADTTARKGAHREILSAYAAGDYDVLVGTQMIGKGLDLSRVTLVGVVAADSGLHLPDFRAPERTFQQIVQVVGRAGRAERPGLAVIQAYVPDHPAVRHAAAQDVEAFLESELKRREIAGMPPFRRMALWTFESKSDELARTAAERSVEELAVVPGEVSGPAPAPLERLRGRYRWQVRWLFPADLPETEIAAACGRAGTRGEGELRIALDIDPSDVM